WPTAQHAGLARDDARPRAGVGREQLRGEIAGAEVFGNRARDGAFDLAPWRRCGRHGGHGVRGARMEPSIGRVAPPKYIDMLLRSAILSPVLPVPGCSVSLRYSLEPNAECAPPLPEERVACPRFFAALGDALRQQILLLFETNQAI